MSNDVLYERLPSGVRLVAEPWGSAPVVAVQVHVGAGSASEPPEWNGAAHLLEHMVFKGGGTRAGAELTAAVEAVGGDINAWTSVDWTCFHITAPIDAFELLVDALADIVLRPWLREDDLRTESGVVLEEIRGADDDAGSVLGDRMRALVWGDHAHGRTVLGTVETVAALTADALQSFHRRQYRPDRMALVVAGPVSVARIRAAAERFDAIAGACVCDDVPEDTPLPGNRPVHREVVFVREGHEDRVVEVAFPTPGPEHADMAALDLLSVCLGDGAAARLPLALRDQQELAVGAWADLETESVGGIFVVGAAPRPGNELAAVTALAESVVAMAQDGPTDAELRRARAIVRADRLRERETVDGRAHRLGFYWRRFDDLAAEQAYFDELEQCTPEAVRAAAATWLRPEVALVGVASSEMSLSEAQVREAWALGAARKAPAVRVERPAVTTMVLENGLKVTVESREDAELVGIAVVGLGGLLREPARKAGLATAWSRLVNRGAGALGATEVAQLAETQSGTLTAWTARNSVGLDSTWPADALPWGAHLVTELMAAPRFDEDEVGRVLDELVIDRELSLDDPSELSWDVAWAKLFAGHAWARPVAGTLAGLAQIDVPALLRYHRAVCVPGNLHVAVSGPVDPNVVRGLFAPLDRLPVGPSISLQPPVIREPTAIRQFVRRVPRDEAQAQVAVGWASPEFGVDGASEPAARVLEGVLSGAQGVGGRLFDRVREELGLAYSVGASWEGGLGGGAFLLHAGTDPTQVRPLLDALLGEVDRVAREGVGADELARVQRGLVDGAVLGNQRSLGRARQLATASAYRGDAARWSEVLRLALRADADQVQALARDVLARHRAVVVVAGPSTLRVPPMS